MRPTCGLALAALIALAGRASAQGSTIAMTTPPGLLTVSSAVAGSAPVGQTDQTARYSVNVVSGHMKIVGQLDAPLPAGVTLAIQLAAPSGAISAGSVSLSTAPQDLVLNIPPGERTGLLVTLVFSASVSAGVVAFTSNNVVLTLVVVP